jgi:hypothetical protein
MFFSRKHRNITHLYSGRNKDRWIVAQNLMNFLQSLTHSFEEDLPVVPPIQGRPSNMHNEDDYDYAIELKEEEEYRSPIF